MKKVIAFLIIFLLAPIAFTFGQAGFYDLEPGKWALGVGHQISLPDAKLQNPKTFNVDSKAFLGSFDYGFSEKVKIQFMPGVSHYDDRRHNPYSTDPSPFVHTKILNVNDTNVSELKFYTSWSANLRHIPNIIRIGDPKRNQTEITLSASGGILHILYTDHGWNLKPFFELAILQAYTYKQHQAMPNEVQGYQWFGGQAGCEFQMSESISAIGSVEFSFKEERSYLYRFGIIFH